MKAKLNYYVKKVSDSNLDIFGFNISLFSFPMGTFDFYLCEGVKLFHTASDVVTNSDLGCTPSINFLLCPTVPLGKPHILFVAKHPSIQNINPGSWQFCEGFQNVFGEYMPGASTPILKQNSWIYMNEVNF